jgi:hypothetical protein
MMRQIDLSTILVGVCTNRYLKGMVNVRWLIKSGLYALWTVGAYILLHAFNDIASRLMNYQESTYHIAVQWLLPLDLVLGMYIGVLFVRHWKLKLNIPLLIFIFLPSLYMNSLVDISILHINPVFLEASRGLTIQDILGVLSGIVLMVGLFSKQKDIKK